MECYQREPSKAYSVDRRVKIVYIEKPYSVWRRQNSTREYEVPETVLDKMLGRLEVPQLTEAHEVVYVVEE